MFPNSKSKIEKLLKVIGVAAGLFLVGVVVVFGFKALTPKPQTTVLGGVNIGNDYHSTTTNPGLPAGDYIIHSGPTALGSIIISSSTAAAVSIIDYGGVTSTPSSTFITIAPNAGTVGGATSSIVSGFIPLESLLFNGLTLRFSVTSTGQVIVTYR